MADTQTPKDVNDLNLIAASHLAFLLSALASGEGLSPDEVAVIRRTIARLEAAANG
jgi:hypothetical protein